MSWNSSSMDSLDDKVAAVTGANSGLGLETTRKLAEKGCEVVMACRDHGKASEATNEIEKDLRDPDLRIIELDTSDPNSVNDFARRFRENYDRLDLMINNVGVMQIPFRRTDFRFEYQFGVNNLGPFYLNPQIIETIEERDDSRVISVSSLLLRSAEIDFESINDDESYDKKTA